MAAGAWKVYTTFKDEMGKKQTGVGDLDGAFAIKIVSASYTPSLAHISLTTGAIATAAAQVANVATDTVALASGTTNWTTTGNSKMFDSTATAVWTATTATMVAKYAILYDTTTSPVNKQLVAYCQLNTTSPSTVSVTPTNTLSLSFNANGIFRLSGAT